MAHNLPGQQDNLLPPHLAGLPPRYAVSVEKPACFRWEERFRCGSPECLWRGDCMKLVAEWRR